MCLWVLQERVVHAKTGDVMDDRGVRVGKWQKVEKEYLSEVEVLPHGVRIHGKVKSRGGHGGAQVRTR